MRLGLSFTAVMIVIGLNSTGVLAQSAGDFLNAATEAYYSKVIDSMLSYLTPEQRAQFEKALYPALDKNPELVQQGLDLLQEGGKKIEESTPAADRDAYVQKMRDYEGRLRTAMLNEDPEIGKIFDEIDSHLKLPTAPPAVPSAAPAP